MVLSGGDARAALDASGFRVRPGDGPSRQGRQPVKGPAQGMGMRWPRLRRRPYATARGFARGAGPAGFTLLEVLVALAVVAIALAAAVSGTATHADAAAHLHARTLAHWVAQNRLTQTQVAGEWPGPGTTTGVEEMGLREWQWTRQVEATADERVHRVTVAVAPVEEPDAPRARITGFVAAPGQGTP